MRSTFILAEEAFMEREEKHPLANNKPSVMVRLRAALGLQDKKVDMIQVITTACERLERDNLGWVDAEVGD